MNNTSREHYLPNVFSAFIISALKIRQTMSSASERATNNKNIIAAYRSANTNARVRKICLKMRE